MRTLKTFSVLLVIGLILSSFGGEPKVFKSTQPWLPEGFDTRNSVLLVENFSTGLKGNANLRRAEDKVTDKMKDEMAKIYPYKYEFASADEISTSAKYANTDMYRYVLIDINGSTPVHLHPTNPNAPKYGSSVNDLFIYDRKLDKSYPPTGHSSGYVTTVLTPMVNTIVQYLHGLTSSPSAQPSANPH